MCDRAGCTTGLAGAWHPKILLYAVPGGTPVEAVLSLKVCWACKGKAGLGEFIGPVRQVATGKAFEAQGKAFEAQGRPAPDWSLTGLGWEEVADGTFQAG